MVVAVLVFVALPFRPVTAPPASDRELIAAHRAGDDHAFGELVRRHRDRMWAVALRTLRDPEEAADAVQDACLSAFRAAAGFRGDAEVGTWLHRIVINACLMRIRARPPGREVPLPDHDTADLAAPGNAYTDRELRMDIEQALARLPEEQRLPILLVEVEGLSVTEAAGMLGIAAGTVKSRCSRGRTRLAVLLGHLRRLPRKSPTVRPTLAAETGGGPASEAKR